MTRWTRALGRRQRWGAAGLLVAVLLGFGGWLAAEGSDSDLLWFDGVASSDTTADEETGESGVGPAEGSGGEREAGSAESAPPYVQPFAQQPDSTPHTGLPSPTAGVEIAEGSDGCDHAYGDRHVCVPWQFPDGVTDKCAWLKSHGFEALKITGGRDRHGLDRNGDGIACGAGD